MESPPVILCGWSLGTTLVFTYITSGNVYGGRRFFVITGTFLAERDHLALTLAAIVPLTDGFAGDGGQYQPSSQEIVSFRRI